MPLTATSKQVYPLTHFILDSHFNIISNSSHAFENFPKVLSFLDLVEEDDRQAAESFLTDLNTLKTNLKLKSKEYYNLYEVFAQKQGNNIELFCAFKEKFDSPLDVIIEENLSLYKENTQKESNLNLKQDKDYQEFESFIAKAKQVAHEVKNPITSVKGFIQLLRPYLVEIGKSDYADVALSELERTNNIIYDFLHQAPCNHNRKEKIHSSILIKEIVILSKAEAVLNKIDINYNASEIEPYLMINGDQIKQVLLNLIKNAIEAIKDNPMEEKGKINISTNLTQEFFIISISDNGPGMSQDTLTNLFSHDFTTKDYGTGIGLSVCNKIINDHCGAITVTSKVGDGSTFKIHLPLNN